jgi:hypothetical protein
MLKINSNPKVDRSLLDTVLAYVRRDGPLTAPFCFLTIEDGGGLSDKELATKADFHASFTEAGTWEPKAGELREILKDSSATVELGHLGIRVAKVMAGLCGIANYSEYILDHLYLRNEVNVKFFPISFPTYDGGNDSKRQPVEGYLGLSLGEYREVCRMLRPDRLLLRKDIFTPERFYVATCSEWFDVLRRIFPNISYYDTYTHMENGKEAFKLYFDEGGVARFAYFGLLSRSTSDKRIEDFVTLVREYADKGILARLQAKAI